MRTHLLWPHLACVLVLRGAEATKPTPRWLTRRAVVGSALLLPAARARAEVRYTPARYTLVPQGSVADKEKRLRDVERELASKSEDPYLLGERAQLEYDLNRLRENVSGVQRLRTCAASGGAYATGLTLRVPDLEAARRFYVDGLKMSELRSDRVGPDRAASIVLGYGRESLAQDDGGKFSLELVQATPSVPALVPLAADARAVAGALLYLQLRVPSVRISKLVEFGGRIESAYGYVDVVSPDGLCLRVLTASRRDPFEFVAVRVADVASAASYYERVFGMKRVPAPPRRLARDGGLLGTGLFSQEYEVQEDVLAPQVVYGSVLMVPSCCEQGDATGVLLVPLDAATVPLGLEFAGGEGDPVLSVSCAEAAEASSRAGAGRDGLARDEAGMRLQIRAIAL